MENEKETREVSIELLQAVIDYLQQRPFHEVNALINEIIKQTKE